MKLHQWLPLLSGTALAGLMVGSLTLTEPPCTYVLGQVGSITVATPAVVLIVPPEEAGEQTPLEADAAGGTCESLGVSTPAVALRLPASAFHAPGALVETSTIVLQFPDQRWSAPGHVLSFQGSTLVLPARRLLEAPPVRLITEPTLTIGLGGELRTARYLLPPP